MVNHATYPHTSSSLFFLGRDFVRSITTCCNIRAIAGLVHCLATSTVAQADFKTLRLSQVRSSQNLSDPMCYFQCLILLIF